MGLTQEVTPDSGYFRVLPRYGAGTWSEIFEKCRQGRPGNLEVRSLDLKTHQTG